ncbi:MAG TPA: hypothetical protein VGK29_11055 [Paludibaculum sp.]|jgi:quinol monooxygenase YgiN
MKLKLTWNTCLAALSLAAIAAPALAQGDIRVVNHVRVKPGSAGDWIAANKDRVALLAKGGSDRGFTVWQSTTGPREYAVVSYRSKWADLDQTADPQMKAQEGPLAAIWARINAATESVETEIHTNVPDSSSPRSTAMPAFVRTGRTTVAPGKMNEVLDLFKNEVAPAWKKAGVSSYGVYRIRYGAPNNQIHTFVAMKAWADLDTPSAVEQAMGAEGFQRFQSKIGALTLRTEFTIYRYRPELSYLPAAK